MYKCIAVFTIVAFQLLCRGECATGLQVVEVGAFNRIRDDVNGLSVARLAERFVSVIRDVDNGHHSPFERCCVLNQMVLRVSAGGLLRAFDEVLQDNPDGGNEIIDGILSFVCSCESVVELRYNVPPERAASSLVEKFKRIFKIPLVDGARQLDERMSTVCGDVEGMLFLRCATEWARVLLCEKMALCRGPGARRCAEEFYGESRRAYRPRKTVYAFPTQRVGVISQLYWECADLYQRTRRNENVVSYLRRCTGLANLLPHPREPADVGDLALQAVCGSYRERVCLAVFPGSQAGYLRPIDRVLSLVWSMPPDVRSWGPLIWVDGLGSGSDGLIHPPRIPSDDDDPLHRFWCWTQELLDVRNMEKLDTLLAEAEEHRKMFDQIAFKQGAYGDFHLLFTWLVMRGYAYRYRDRNAEVESCPFDPPKGRSVFRLVPTSGDQYIRQLFAICRSLGGDTWADLQRDFSCVLQKIGDYDNDCQHLVSALYKIQSTEPKEVRFLGIDWDGEDEFADWDG